MTQKNERPGRGGNLSEPGFDHTPSKDMKMNSSETITRSAETPAPSAGGNLAPTGASAEYCAAWAKCRELGKQLSQALKETGDEEYAFVRPAGVDFAVLFGSLEADTATSTFAGLAVDRVSRLSSQLSVALDEWNDQTKVRYMAHVPPASSGLSIWYENAGRVTDTPRGSEAVGRISELANEVATILVANPDLKIDRISINEHGVHQFRKIPGVPSVKETL